MHIKQIVTVLSCSLMSVYAQAGALHAPPHRPLPPSVQDITQPAQTAPSKQAISSLPTDEQGFIKAIAQLDKAKIVELLGEPARADDVKLKDSGRVVASIWHYHYINTSAEGKYYPTTELDFIDDKVKVVVFLNNDGSERDDVGGKSYALPQTVE